VVVAVARLALRWRLCLLLLRPEQELRYILGCTESDKATILQRATEVISRGVLEGGAALDASGGASTMPSAT